MIFLFAFMEDKENLTDLILESVNSVIFRGSKMFHFLCIFVCNKVARKTISSNFCIKCCHWTFYNPPYDIFFLFRKEQWNAKDAYFVIKVCLLLNNPPTSTSDMMADTFTGVNCQIFVMLYYQQQKQQRKPPI